jgi:tRNA pseudouridine38-40 synthase
MDAFRLTLEYEGTRFRGWQHQGESSRVRTVSGEVLRVLAEAALKVRAFVGSGRTDAGVHAMAQVAHLHLGPPAPEARKLAAILRAGLPADVAVTDVRPCDPAFSARHDAVERTYLYQVALRPSPLARRHAWIADAGLDAARAREAWARFEGFFDVAAFATPLEGEDTRCEVRSCESAVEGGALLLRVTASHFLRRQVRRMAGAAVACGLGRADPDAVARDLARPTPEANAEWTRHTAPPDGLFLEHVRYPGEPARGPLAAVVRIP